MQEYTDNGVKLSWLIDPQQRIVKIYRGDRPTETLESPVVLKDELLPGFELKLNKI